MKSRLTVSAHNVFAILIVILCSSAFALLQLHSIGSSEYLGTFVVDAVSLKHSLKAYDILNGGVGRFIEIFGEAKSFAALAIIYLFTATQWGYLCDLLTNIILILLTCREVLKINKKYGDCGNNLLFIYFAIFIFINPYINSVSAFPNKEIPLMLLSSIFAAGLLSGAYIKVFVVIFITYFVRDGYAIVLLLATCLYYWFQKFKITHILSISLLLFLSLLVSLEDFSFFGGAFARNTAVGSIYQNNNIFKVNNVAFDFVYNYITLGVRTQFFSSTSLYVLNVGLWLLGVVLLIALPTALMEMKDQSRLKVLIGSLLLCVMLALLYSSYNQPRYFMPLLPLMLITLLKVHPRTTFTILCFTIFLNPVLYYLGMLPPLQIGIDPESAMRAL